MAASTSTSKREKQKGQAIQVFIRSRPINTQEHELGSGNVIDILNSKELGIRQQYGKRYTFDKIFGPNNSQMDVYNCVVQPMIAEVIAGYNCTVFAYGQTGTGKTYTMAGGSATGSELAWQENVEAGIIPRALSNLFDELNVIQHPYTVRVSYLELYNEELFDLLSHTVDSKGIRLFEDPHQKGSVIIHGITKETVLNKRQVYEILEKGQDKRRTASTLLNAQSSRSHTVFSIMVHTCETIVEGEDIVRTGKLNLVDLAGSENIGRSGATDQRAREAGSINQSLLTLGRVIKALVERSGHIPYRESKLTRILQDSLGGRTKTSIIATISPAAVCLEETLSTLDYANRARNITNRPEVNQIVSQKMWKDQYEKELEILRKDLEVARTKDGVYLAQEKYDRLVFDNTMFKEELADKISVVRDLEQKLCMKEEELKGQISDWDQLHLSFEAARMKVAAYRAKLKQTEQEKQTEAYVASCFESKTHILYTEAQKLIGMSKETATKLHIKVDDLRSLSMQNNNVFRQVFANVMEKSLGVLHNLTKFSITADTCTGNAAAILNTLEEYQNHCTDIGERATHTLEESCKQLLYVVCQDLKNSLKIDIQHQQNQLNAVHNNVNEVQKTQVVMQTDLQAFKADAEGCVENLMQDLTNQTELNQEILKEIKGVGKDIMSVMARVESLEQKVLQSEKRTKMYVKKLLVTHENTLERCNTLSAASQQLTHIVTRSLTAIDEIKESDTCVLATVRKLDQSIRNFLPAHEVPSELTPQTFIDKVRSTTKRYNEAAQDTQREFDNNSKGLYKCLLTLKENVETFKIASSGALTECRDDLSDSANRLIDPTTDEDSPIKASLASGAMAITPRERLLQRYLEGFSGEQLNFDDSLLSTSQRSPESDSEGTEDTTEPSAGPSK